jgi:hypothetical protein
MTAQVQTIVSTALHGFYFFAGAILLGSLAISAQVLPAGTALEVRLSVAAGSRPTTAIQYKRHLSRRLAFTDGYLFRRDQKCLGP